MSSQEGFVPKQLNFTNKPFPHFSLESVFKNELAFALVEWLKKYDKWEFTETSFYTQYEFSLIEAELPKSLSSIISDDLAEKIALYLQQVFEIKKLKLVGITAHKLLNGYKMGVHNDFIGKEESHRLVIQLNDGWSEQNGGYLMLFNSKNPSDVANVVMPTHNSGVGFEISSNSYHAVSTVYDFERYTLVYTFTI